jgi:hypothetical protein
MFKTYPFVPLLADISISLSTILCKAPHYQATKWELETEDYTSLSTNYNQESWKMYNREYYIIVSNLQKISLDVLIF